MCIRDRYQRRVREAQETQGRTNMNKESQLKFDYAISKESNARSYSRKFPMVIKKAKGMYLTTDDGKNYMDCLGNAGTLALGHNPDVLVDVVKQFLKDERPWQALDLITESKLKFIKSVYRALPKEMQDYKIQFCGPSGSDCIEAAIKLAKTATKRRTMICFAGGYHGMGHGSMSLTGSLGPKKNVPNLMSGVHVFPYPYSYRCPFGIGGEQGTKSIVQYIENTLADPESGITAPAAIVLEALQGEGGVIPAPPEFLQGLRRITTERDIPLIVDEIQAGWGRTGKMFGFQWGDIIPDMVTMSKASGGGMPMAFLLYHPKYDVWGPGAHAGTFRGNQIAMEVGAATIDYIIDKDLCSHVTEVGAHLEKGLLELKKQYDCVGDVRGRGLMLGLELVDTAGKKSSIGSFPPHQDLALLVQQLCFQNLLILEKGGRNSATLRFLPPLIITKKEIDQCLEILGKAIAEGLEKLKK
eukprot:TRINITY_DN2698_c0_g2_i1.p1 TRINITY_DN2698_c0_g2~~TRINITY_DN2698_c0_g2_i1.p1  ORF type:complete len:470 (+),score=97.10 TRINITY_DN2698_c0_g2_i1:47-1456(+)